MTLAIVSGRKAIKQKFIESDPARNPVKKRCSHCTVGNHCHFSLEGVFLGVGIIDMIHVSHHLI